MDENIHTNTTNQEPYIVTEIPNTIAEKPHCKTLRNQFPFMWKLCLTYGFCYLLFAYQNTDGIGSGIFALVSAYFLLWIAKKLKGNPIDGEHLAIAISTESVFYYLAAVLISFGNCLTDNGFFLFFNHVGSFLLFSIASIKLFYKDKQWDFGKYTSILFSFWFQTLEVIPVPFRDFTAHRKGTKKKMPDSVRYVIIGILCGLPILIVTTLLLGSADRVFSNVIESIFDFEAFTEWFFSHLTENMFILPCLFIFYCFLLYLVIAALCKKNLSEEVRMPKKHGVLIAVTIFIMIDVMYVLFSGIQFVCLFIGIMPSSWEYAEYAREGFFELLFVALINFFLVLFCNRHFNKNGVLKVLMTITCLCTYVMIASSAYRMWMYVDVYHLTFLRVFVLWFLAMLCFFMAGSLISIFKEKWNTFRYCLFVLTCFYTVFALANVDKQIAKYNVAQFEKSLPEIAHTYAAHLQESPTAQQSSYDVVYSQFLETNIPSLYVYLPDGYEESKAYATVLYDLYAHYGLALDEHNISTITDYFSMRHHFYLYDYERSSYEHDHYVLDENTAIYDTDVSNSIFMWKHFNFVEYDCYRLCKLQESVEK
ncbi:MAG: DUF4173 domain-containing protein [Lachnospiraceae bacterium]|nr:DUF4173 domain-containing protein [Lachnospiraceae bacterium]